MSEKKKIVTVKPRKTQILSGETLYTLTDGLIIDEQKEVKSPNTVYYSKRTNPEEFPDCKVPISQIEVSNDEINWVDLTGMMRMANYRFVRLKEKE